MSFFKSLLILSDDETVNDMDMNDENVFVSQTPQQNEQSNSQILLEISQISSDSKNQFSNTRLWNLSSVIWCLFVICYLSFEVYA